jgi:eukaryotic-like serine/threonine-protein kinase
MSPEQIEGRPVDARSDLFSLGVMLYELLTGDPPFQGETDLATIAQILCTENARPVRERAPGAPPWLASIVDHLIEKDPILRPQSAAEVLARLRGP